MPPQLLIVTADPHRKEVCSTQAKEAGFDEGQIRIAETMEQVADLVASIIPDIAVVSNLPRMDTLLAKTAIPCLLDATSECRIICIQHSTRKGYRGKAEYINTMDQRMNWVTALRNRLTELRQSIEQSQTPGKAAS